eukprot:Awhi_evm1s5708
MPSLVDLSEPTADWATRTPPGTPEPKFEADLEHGTFQIDPLEMYPLVNTNNFSALFDMMPPLIDPIFLYELTSDFATRIPVTPEPMFEADLDHRDFWPEDPFDMHPLTDTNNFSANLTMYDRPASPEPILDSVDSPFMENFSANFTMYDRPPSPEPILDSFGSPSFVNSMSLATTTDLFPVEFPRLAAPEPMFGL